MDCQHIVKVNGTDGKVSKITNVDPYCHWQYSDLEDLAISVQCCPDGNIVTFTNSGFYKYNILTGQMIWASASSIVPYNYSYVSLAYHVWKYKIYWCINNDNSVSYLGYIPVDPDQTTVPSVWWVTLDATDGHEIYKVQVETDSSFVYTNQYLCLDFEGGCYIQYIDTNGEYRLKRYYRDVLSWTITGKDSINYNDTYNLLDVASNNHLKRTWFLPLAIKYVDNNNIYVLTKVVGVSGTRWTSSKDDGYWIPSVLNIDDYSYGYWSNSIALRKVNIDTGGSTILWNNTYLNKDGCYNSYDQNGNVHLFYANNGVISYIKKDGTGIRWARSIANFDNPVVDIQNEVFYCNYNEQIIEKCSLSDGGIIWQTPDQNIKLLSYDDGHVYAATNISLGVKRFVILDISSGEVISNSFCDISDTTYLCSAYLPTISQ